MSHITPVYASQDAIERWVERVARAMYEADQEFGPMETNSWEEACDIGYDEGYRERARTALFDF